MSATLLTFLQSGSTFLVAELCELTPKGGNALYFTSAERDVVYGGRTYTALDFERGEIEYTTGIQVPTLNMTVYATAEELIQGSSWEKAAVNGYFDDCSLVYSLLFFRAWDNPVGVCSIFHGTLSDIEINMIGVSFTFKGITEVFNQMFPRNLYQSTCPFLLYDGNCGVSANDFRVAGTVSTGSTRTAITDPGLGQAADYFTFGYIEFTSGSLAGSRFTIETSVPGLLTLLVHLPELPAVGDTFFVYPGCDRTKATCNTKFSNDQFGGQPFIPKPETLY